MYVKYDEPLFIGRGGGAIFLGGVYVGICGGVYVGIFVGWDGLVGCDHTVEPLRDSSLAATAPTTPPTTPPTIAPGMFFPIYFKPVLPHCGSCSLFTLRFTAGLSHLEETDAVPSSSLLCGRKFRK